MKFSFYDMAMVFFLGIMTAVAPLAMDMYLPALPEVSEELHVSPSLAQLTLTAVMVGMALGQLVGGPLSDKMGRRRPALVGMSLFALSSWLCTKTNSIYLFLLLRFIQGFFGSFGLVIARAIAKDIKSGDDLLRFYSILMMIQGIAPVLAPVSGGIVLQFTDWHGVLELLTAVALLLTLGCIIYKETLPADKRIPDVKRTFRSFPALFRDSYFMGCCLVQGFLFIAFFGYLAASSFVFQDIYGLSPKHYSYILGTIGLGLFLTSALPGKMAGHVLDDSMLRWSILLSFMGSLMLLPGLYFRMSLLYVLPVLFITIVPLSVVETVSLSMGISRQGKRAGAASAMIGFFSVAPGGLAMPLVGIAGKETALPMALVMVAGYGLCFLSYWKWVHGR